MHTAPLHRRFFIFSASTLILAASSALAADGIKSLNTYKQAYGDTKTPVVIDPAKDLPRDPAQSPDEALKSFKMKKGFALEHVAHEPQVRSPIALSFDELGRMFVVEMIDYSELRDVTPHLGRVSMLEDQDGDGYFETSTVYADDLPWPTGVICSKGGIYVASTPDIWFFKDTSGDGKADMREKVFTGFGTGLKVLNVQGLMNCFNWGLDGRIHMQCGGGNRGIIKCVASGEASKQPEQEVAGRDFNFNPINHSFAFEPGGGQYGFSYDSWGHKFVCSNSDHLQFYAHDGRYTDRNPFYSLPNPRQSIAVDGGAAEVYRASPDEPWRIIRTRWRISNVVKGSVEGGGRVSGYFTGATGTTAYTGDAYGPEFVDNTFTGDAGGNLVHRKLILPDGASLKGQRPDDEQGMEFLASSHTWFRPVNFANAPDGCLYVIDMHREVIEHPWSIPEEIKKHIDLNSGSDRGRIYRIVRDEAKPRRASEVPLPAATEALVKLLGHSNGWHRQTAARLLIERQDKAAATLINAVLSIEKTTSTAHFAMLHVLAALGELKDGHIISAMKDKDEHVRESGVLLGDALINAPGASKALSEAALYLLQDPAPCVVMAACSVLGNARDVAVGSRLLAVAGRTTDSWIQAAILSAKPDLLGQAFATDANGAGSSSIGSELMAMIGARNNPSEVAAAIAVAAETGNAKRIAALGNGLKKAKTSLAAADTQQRLAPVFAKALKTVADSAAKDSDRLAALPLVALSTAAESTPVLTACLGKGTAAKVQMAVLDVIATQLDDKAADLILGHWGALQKEARGSAVTALLARPASALALLKAVNPTTGDLPNQPSTSDLSPSQIQSLLHHADKAVATLADKVLVSVKPKSRAEVFAQFQPALGLKGDAAKGQVQFMGRCFACHRAGGQGMAVGPDLLTVKTKGREAIMTAILDPHKEVAPQFIAFTVNTKDGQTMSGIVTKDDATSLTLKSMGGIETVYPRANLKGTSSTGQSLMPEGLEAGLDGQGMADLLTFVEGLTQ